MAALNLRIVTININGLRHESNTLHDFIIRESLDVVLLQETKLPNWFTWRLTGYRVYTSPGPFLLWVVRPLFFGLPFHTPLSLFLPFNLYKLRLSASKFKIRTPLSAQCIALQQGLSRFKISLISSLFILPTFSAEILMPSTSTGTVAYVLNVEGCYNSMLLIIITTSLDLRSLLIFPTMLMVALMYWTSFS